MNLLRLALALGFSIACFGESRTLLATPIQLATPLEAEARANATLDQWPGGNRKARKMTRKSRRRTFLKTRGSAVKTMFARKSRNRKFKKASKQGFNKADKSAAPPKRAGCNG